MSYYKVLGLENEPFSTSPDPHFFYRSISHQTALKRLEINIRLRRGLSLIFGDVGIGKTTLCRMLLQSFSGEDAFIFHMILDPSFRTEYQFLSQLIKMLGIRPSFKSTLDFKESIEKFLFHVGVRKNRTIILLIDEGQKISLENLEVLRTLLNYETNEYKLLQLVIMSQIEIIPRLKRVPNFIDRASFKYTINPLDEEETDQMIQFRLCQAGFRGGRDLFTRGAVKLIYQHTQGYPRKISMICHEALERAVMDEKTSIEAVDIEKIISFENALS